MVAADQTGDVLREGGEMGALMRSIDWSSTPLGPVDSWSPSLRTTVRILLANRFPLLLWWGPDHRQLYNDAYRPVLGSKHPRSMGQPARECWPEIWDVIGPLIATPYHGGPSTWADDICLELNRHGFIEETHFTIAYSPVPDDTVASGVGGVLATVHEITQQVIQERRMVVLRDLGSRSSEAKTAEEACQIAADVFEHHARDVPFALLYLADADQTTARLAATAGIRDLATVPALVDLTPQARPVWPLAAALRAEAPQLVESLEARFARVPAGPWSDPPTQALVLPIRSHLQRRWAGVLVLGISARLRFDDSYRGFCDLATAQVATAIGNARAYEAERDRAELLAQLDRAKTTFFSNVSHEFRTPLTLSLGPIEDLLNGSNGPLGPEQRQALEVAHRNSLRLLRLVNTVLDFSRIEAGRVEAAYHATDLASVTTDLASTFRSAIERAGLQLVVDCPPLPDGVEVFVDRDLWEKVVLNLLSNALKFTFAGQIVVAVHPTADQRAIELVVRDTGTGIAPDELPRLFERFHRVQGAQARTHEGTGIGLALVSEIVKLHGGEIDVDSTVGAGTTFTLRIPTGSDHLPSERIRVSDAMGDRDTAIGAAPFVEEALRWLPTADTRTSESSFARVLLADDNTDMREYVARLLRTRYAVDDVADGASALERARAHPPDLVLADVMMPGLDGFQLLSALRSDPRTREIPVVLLSARAGEEARVDGIDAGADDYLVKPFAARELLARVSTHLELARVRSESAERERRARAEADAARQHLHDLFMQAPACICVLRGPELVYDLANAPYLEAIGRRADEVLGKRLRDVLADVEGRGRLELLERVYATGEPFVGTEIPLRVQRGDDRPAETVYYNAVYQPTRNPDGEVDCIVIHAVDVTRAVRARQVLRESEERFRNLAETAHEGIWLIDTDACTLFANARMAELLGTSIDALVGRRVTDFCFDDDMTFAHERSARNFRGESEQFDFRFRRADGTAIYVLAATSPVRDVGGQIVGALGMFSDVTERRHADQERQRLEQEKDDFLAAASHDLRNPLATIKGGAQLLQRQARRGTVDLSRMVDALCTIDTAATQMGYQIDDLLDVSRVRLGRPLELNRKPTDLVDLARRVVATEQVTSERHQISISTSVPRLVGTWDPRRLERALGNLLSNAIKYSPDGGPIELRLARSESADGAEAVLAVSDRGVGIPAADLPRIFEQFHRAANVADSIPGTGIGLAGVRQIVEQHGGTIGAESREGEGSTFTVRLPLT